MSSPVEIKVPDIGDFDAVEIIEILITEGQRVSAEDALLTLESDKATMDIPAPQDGVITKLLVEVGQMISQGSAIALLEVDDAGAGGDVERGDDVSASASPQPEPAATVDASAPTRVTQPASAPHQPPPTLPPIEPSGETPHASPAVRRFARELGARLAEIRGSGGKGRILKDDVTAWVKAQLTAPSQSGGGIPPIPAIDFSKFGEVENVPLSRIAKLSGPHLQRAWLNIPHVTHHDEADITELEDFRQSLKAKAKKEDVRITMLGFAIKILAQALQKFPTFNASLHPDGKTLIVKKYYNIGIAVDTPHGLVVPVLKDVQDKSLFELAREMGELSERARDGKLRPDDLQGGCISISSLGGIGGNAFTPIVNAPEVAILGITRARMTPIWNGSEFQPKLMLPLDLSYDHRVIDGANAARFVAHLAQSFADVQSFNA